MLTCLSVLDGADGAALDWQGQSLMPTANLVTIYRRRANHVEAIGLPTVGVRETVERLAQTTLDTLRVVGAISQGGYPACVMFIAPQEPVVVAAFAVLGPMPTT